MTNITLNKELYFTIPDGFQDSTKEELKLKNDVNDNSWWAVRSAERRVILIVRWQKYNALALKLADKKTMVKTNEQRTRKVFENTEYKLRGFFTTEAAGDEAEGYRYSYHVEGIEQNVDTVLIKTKHFVYNLSLYGRKENEEQNQSLLEEILASVSID